MKYTKDELYSLVKKLSELDVNELTVKNEDLTIKIKNKKVLKTTKETKIDTQDGNMEANKETAEKAEKPGKVIAAPIHGTFYTASGPEESPYIKTGDKVKKGEPICILEAMKMMNTINMPEDGEILAVEVSNEDIVDTGQALVRYNAV